MRGASAEGFGPSTIDLTQDAEFDAPRLLLYSFRTIVVSTLTLIFSSILATAAEVCVLSVGSTQIAAKAIATEFEKQTRNKVTFTIRPTV